MTVNRNDILAQLQKEILPLQGYKPSTDYRVPKIELGPITTAFPEARFPSGAIHEFLSIDPYCSSATSGFIAFLVAAFMQRGRASIWISPSRTLFPPALVQYGIQPDKIIFIHLQKEADILWVMEEALACEGIAAVVAELPGISFTASRRLQLAVEKSGVTGFIIRQNPSGRQTNACLSRWKITPLSSDPNNELPGIGFPRWKIELLKIRNGRPGAWEMEWSPAGLVPVSPQPFAIPAIVKRKTG